MSSLRSLALASAKGAAAQYAADATFAASASLSPADLAAHLTREVHSLRGDDSPAAARRRSQAHRALADLPSPTVADAVRFHEFTVVDRGTYPATLHHHCFSSATADGAFIQSGGRRIHMSGMPLGPELPVKLTPTLLEKYLASGECPCSGGWLCCLGRLTAHVDALSALQELMQRGVCARVVPDPASPLLGLSVQDDGVHLIPCRFSASGAYCPVAPAVFRSEEFVSLLQAQKVKFLKLEDGKHVPEGTPTVHRAQFQTAVGPCIIDVHGMNTPAVHVVVLKISVPLATPHGFLLPPFPGCNIMPGGSCLTSPWCLPRPIVSRAANWCLGGLPVSSKMSSNPASVSPISTV